MKKKKKMMYLSNVNWSWIKQRPQFLAEELSIYYDIDVYLKKEYKKSKITGNKINNNINFKKIFRFPMERYNFISKINKFIVGRQLVKVCNNYDILFLTDPSYYPWMKASCKNKIIIYDCMDDNAEFPYIKNNLYKLRAYLKAEKMLIKDCTLLITTSNYLKNVLIDRYKIDELEKKIFVVNNAIDSNTIKIKENKLISNEKKDKVNIVYIGTIETWMDFDLIIRSLDDCHKLIYNIYGPSGIDIPKHDRLIWHGPVEHSEIVNIMESADILVMPFKIIPLILSVNPVKLYEYISSLKPVIAVDYEETRKFDEYVYLYKNYDQYMNIIKDIMNGAIKKEKDVEGIKQFLAQNTWAERAKFINDKIER